MKEQIRKLEAKAANVPEQLDVSKIEPKEQDSMKYVFFYYFNLVLFVSRDDDKTTISATSENKEETVPVDENDPNSLEEQIKVNNVNVSELPDVSKIESQPQTSKK